MKRSILYFTTGLFLTASAWAQIPNNGFENWTSAGSYQNPDNWDNLNAMTTSMSVYTCTKGTPGNPGTAYLKLVSKNVSGMGVMPGIAATGTINVGNMNVTGGFAFAQRPQSMTGAWQYMAYGADAGFVAVYLTKWNSGMNKRDTVAMALQSLSGMVMSWQNFTLNLTYMSGGNPDTAQIILSSSGMTPVANSYLYADNLAFTGSVAGVKENGCLITQLSLFPNPANDQLTLELTLAKKNDLKIQVLDLSGKIIKEVNEIGLTGKVNKTLDLSALSKGVYFVRLLADQGSEVRKLIIN